MSLYGFNTFSGVKIIVSEHALEDTDVRLFPESKHRSKRIRKKLIKRHGGEFRKRPCIWRTPEAFIMHPVRKAELDAELRRQQSEIIRTAEQAVFYGATP